MTQTQTPSKTFYIPARKEAATISKVVRSLIWAADRSKIGLDSISVVDEGSTDNTAAVAAEADARVVASSPLFQALKALTQITSRPTCTRQNQQPQ
jgi:hypothetical protein